MKRKSGQQEKRWYYFSLTAVSSGGKKSPVFGKVGFKSLFERRWESLIAEKFELGAFGSDQFSFHGLVKIGAAQLEQLQTVIGQLLEEMPTRSGSWKHALKRVDDGPEHESIEQLIDNLRNGTPLPPKDGGNGHPPGPEI